MKKVNFLFGIHNHQPVGNFDFVFEEAYQKSYLPFIETLERHPNIRIAIHYTGILIEWILANHPEYFPRVRKMVESGQLEILTGGFYEPILAVIPKHDRLGQINKLTSTVKDVFGYDAKGMWLAERIWEPTLPTTLNEAGISFTILDDTHFKYAGLREENLHGYYMTEDLGNNVNLFPISKHLRYAIPFEDPQATVDHLRSWATDEGENIVVFADDGEKFGVWPNTFDHVYTNGWLDRFFNAIEENLEWINLMHFQEALDQFKPLGRIYLPTASYAEMGEWSLFSQASGEFVDFEHYLMDQGVYEDNNVFVRGGFWRNFLAKYREVNDMHKKMLRLSNNLWSLPEEDKKNLSKAFDHIWAAQCNCPYWHGVFGGIYLSHIRDAIYANLIEAEKEWDNNINRELPTIEVTDIDADGFDEVIVETKTLNAYFDLKLGGMLYELDYKPLSKNIIDTMTRRQEAYHKKLEHATGPGEEQDGTASIHDLVLAKESNLVSKLHYDQYDRKSFIDHFLSDQVTLDEFAEGRYQEQGNFVQGHYSLKDQTKGKDEIRLVLEKEGIVSGKPLSVSKEVRIGNDFGNINAVYTLTNLTDEPINTEFGIEFNFGLQAGHAHDRYYFLDNQELDDPYLDSKGVLENNRQIGLRDEWRKLNIRLVADEPATIWRFPIETISLSEGGFERVYQSSAVLFRWTARIGKKWSVKLDLSIDTLR